jgi:hypothetical protein
MKKDCCAFCFDKYRPCTTCPCHSLQREEFEEKARLAVWAAARGVPTAQKNELWQTVKVLLAHAREEGIHFGRALQETETEALGSFEAGRAAERDNIKTIVVDEINVAHQEGTPTARLTSLYNRLSSRTNPPKDK